MTNTKNYGIYTNGTLYKSFKTFESASKVWKQQFTDAEMVKKYDEVTLVNMKTGEVIERVTFLNEEEAKALLASWKNPWKK